MNNSEKKMCDIIFKDGKVLQSEVSVQDGLVIEWYKVECDGFIYHIAKHNSEWAYIIRG